MYQEHNLDRLDAAAVVTAFLSFFKLIPWPEIAAFLAALYTFLRLIGMAMTWLKTHRRKPNKEMK